MADCQKHYHCVPASEYAPLEAATLAILAVIIAAVSGFLGPAAGVTAGIFWIAAVFDLCRYLHGGKLICLGTKVCVIGRVVKLIPVGQDKSGLEQMDDDYTFNIVLSPHASTETVSDIAGTDPNQGKYLQEQPGPKGLGLGYEGELVKFTNLANETEVLHCEIKGCRVHDVCSVLKAMSFFIAAALVVASIPFLGWFGPILLALLALFTLLVGGIVWAATHNGELSDVLDPNSGTLTAADPNTGLWRRHRPVARRLGL